MSLYHKFSNENEKLLRTIKEYGFDVDYDNLLSYLQNKLKKIDEITPLKN
jgi:hypothetical protein